MDEQKECRVSRITTSDGAPGSVHELVVDHSECHSALLAAVRASRCFDVQMDRLATGDYLVNGEVLVERKTISDLAASLAFASAPLREGGPPPDSQAPRC